MCVRSSLVGDAIRSFSTRIRVRLPAARFVDSRGEKSGERRVRGSGSTRNQAHRYFCLGRSVAALSLSQTRFKAVVQSAPFLSSAIRGSLQRCSRIRSFPLVPPRENPLAASSSSSKFEKTGGCKRNEARRSSRET